MSSFSFKGKPILYPAFRIKPTEMKKPALLFFLLLFALFLKAQDETDRSLIIGGFGGIVSYQGDLQPNSFSFDHSKAMYSLWLRQPLSNHFSVKAGLSRGNLNASDKYNRDYLQQRNLSFATDLKEAFFNVEFALMDISKTRFTPFGYAGFVYFHFNPYTYDTNGTKYYLQPLSTEGEGLADYPDRKPYKLNQVAIAFGGGLRFAVNNDISISLEASQRKTFTDYLDDVSKTYVDHDKLLAAKGAKAVELASRSGELHNGAPYPPDGEQRGTPTEMDWYYFTGISVEIKLHTLTNVFSKMRPTRRDTYFQRCPKVY